MGLKRFIARLYDLPNAYRVLDIMDKCSVDIAPAVNVIGQISNDYFDVQIKHWLNEKEAKDLRCIVTYKEQYKERKGISSKIFWRIFPTYRKDCRILKEWNL